MKAMILSGVTDLLINSEPLSEGDITTPTPAKDQILIRITACGVSHTELEEIEGKNTPLLLPYHTRTPDSRRCGRDRRKRH